ncbi:hypothetical protein [Carboxydothermus ferrireducens]|uniref:FlaG/YvyC family protein n=1 Tax=Carboxydothermus ferrireducens DSM 11255 TaxID=1119529 RepID=A0ABX2RAL9_9THEO|nr:hypothetical protein [Carboxydothermus ferrireducens]NYE56892.1 putative FlaG/YvyC family protein [Carboxydothermus ferrireducens DSM 11255]
MVIIPNIDPLFLQKYREQVKPKVPEIKKTADEVRYEPEYDGEKEFIPKLAADVFHRVINFLNPALEFVYDEQEEVGYVIDKLKNRVLKRVSLEHLKTAFTDLTKTIGLLLDERV